MEQSILKSTKTVLHIGEDDEAFDLAIMTHINSAFSTLHDLGVGPEEGFVVEDVSSKWEDFLDPEIERVQLSQVKTFVYIHTRLLFDPPTSSFVQTSAEKQMEELTWRLSVRRESDDWVDANPPVLVEEGWRWRYYE